MYSEKNNHKHNTYMLYLNDNQTSAHAIFPQNARHKFTESFRRFQKFLDGSEKL